MLRTLLKAVVSRQLVKGVLVGIGGGVLTAIGWKLGTDVYEIIKRRMQQKAEGGLPEAAAETEATE